MGRRRREGPWYQQFGARIRAAREAMGYDQKDVARLMKVSPSAVSRWEDGQATDPDELANLATVLNVTTDDLLRPAGYSAVRERPEIVKDVDVDVLRRKLEAELRPTLRAELGAELAKELRGVLDRWAGRALSARRRGRRS